jgi:hypothetical protein
MVPVPGHWDRGGIDGGLDQEPVETEAGVALASVGVENPDRRPPAGRSGSVATDDHLRSLADDVSPEADPRAPGELEADAGGFADGRDDVLAESRRLQHDERDPGPPRQAGKPAQPIGDPLPGQPGREVDDQEIDRPTGEQRAGDRQPLVGVSGRQDHEPLRPDPASDGLHGIERGSEVQPGHDRAGRLGFGDQPQGEGRPAAGEIAAEREAHAARQPAGPEDGIDGREARRQHAPGLRSRRLLAVLERPQGECPDDLPGRRRGSRAPARPEGREGRRDVRGKLRHPGQYRTFVRMNQEPDLAGWGGLLDSLPFGCLGRPRRMGM